MRLADLPLILPAILLLPGMLPAQRIAIGEFALPDARSYPLGIALGPDGALFAKRRRSPVFVQSS